MSDGSGIEQWKSLLEDPLFINMDRKDKFDSIKAKMSKDSQLFFKFHGLTPHQFDSLLELIEPHILIEPKCPGLYLSITLRYMSSGDSDDYYSEHFGINEILKQNIVMDVCNIICISMMHMYRFQSAENRIVQNAADFEKLWNFPNCVGAIDARHILCMLPDEIGTTFELEILAVCDAYFRVVEFYADVGTRETVERLFLASPYYSQVEKASAQYNPTMKKNSPLVFVGGTNGFSRKHILRAFNENNLDQGKLIFNLRHQNAMTAVDTAFGIIFKRWKIFQPPFIGTFLEIYKMLQCVVVLHNFLIDQEKFLAPSEKFYMPKCSTTNAVRPFKSGTSRASMTLGGMKFRQEYVDYFVEEMTTRQEYVDYFGREGAVLAECKNLEPDKFGTVTGKTASNETSQMAEECRPVADTPQPRRKDILLADTAKLARDGETSRETQAVAETVQLAEVNRSVADTPQPRQKDTSLAENVETSRENLQTGLTSIEITVDFATGSTSSRQGQDIEIGSKTRLVDRGGNSWPLSSHRLNRHLNDYGKPAKRSRLSQKSFRNPDSQQIRGRKSLRRSGFYEKGSSKLVWKLAIPTEPVI